MRSVCCLLVVPGILVAQSASMPPALSVERADFTQWLETSPVSPFAAIYHQPFEGRLTFGPDGDPALTTLPPATLSQDLFRLALHTADGVRTIPRNRPVPFGRWHILVSGDRARSTVTVFATPHDVAVPGWYGYRPDLVVQGAIEPPPVSPLRRMLGLDGVEVEATFAGTFVTELAGEPVRLAVYRMPDPGTEESELMIFFRDATNGHGTYPAGRFLALEPLGGDRYQADFNRARNPFCGYNGIFPCPLPWRGNAISAPIEAGERYVSR